MYEARCCEASDMAESKAEILLEILPPFPPPFFLFDTRQAEIIFRQSASTVTEYINLANFNPRTGYYEKTRQTLGRVHFLLLSRLLLRWRARVASLQRRR